MQSVSKIPTGSLSSAWCSFTLVHWWSKLSKYFWSHGYVTAAAYTLNVTRLQMDPILQGTNWGDQDPLLRWWRWWSVIRRKSLFANARTHTYKKGSKWCQHYWSFLSSLILLNSSPIWHSHKSTLVPHVTIQIFATYFHLSLPVWTNLKILLNTLCNNYLYKSSLMIWWSITIWSRIKVYSNYRGLCYMFLFFVISWAIFCYFCKRTSTETKDRFGNNAGLQF